MSTYSPPEPRPPKVDCDSVPLTFDVVMEPMSVQAVPCAPCARRILAVIRDLDALGVLASGCSRLKSPSRFTRKPLPSQPASVSFKKCLRIHAD